MSDDFSVLSSNGGLAVGPLDGVRILDLTHVVAGPTCTQLLGDMGADVIKVESPDGDLTRSLGPRQNPGMASNYLIFNRNKRSIVLDLQHPDGHAALLRIAQTSDVFVVNRRLDVLKRLGIEYADLSTACPAPWLWLEQRAARRACGR
jgi:crotonobetainyl-CoA:carnitine CoA-transferase CaiB-like acyl-CoA transferase